MQKTYKIESLNLNESPAMYIHSVNEEPRPPQIMLGLSVRLDKPADLPDVLRRLHEAGIRLEG